MKKIISKDFWQTLDFMQERQPRLIAVFLLLIALACDVMAFILNWMLGIILLVALVLAIVLVLETLGKIVERTNEYISDLSYRIKRGEQDALVQMPIGILFYSKDYDVQWINPTLQQYFGKVDLLGKPLKNVDSELLALISKHQEEETFFEAKWRDNYFNILIQPELHVAYLYEVTHYVELQKHFSESQLVIGQIFVDNYDEVTKAMNDKSVSNLSNFVTNAIDDWANEFGMFVKRVDEDQYLVLGYTKSLQEIEQQRFKILDTIREWTSKQNSPLTLSIGLAYGQENLASLAKLAQSNLDLALGRGGDQAVVRQDDGQARFYGGKTNPMAKRTRVRARMISQALKELMAQSEEIFVMGHTRPDMDSIGACLGLRRIAEMNKKQCWIVLDNEVVHSDIARLLEELGAYPEIKEKIISTDEALEKISANSLLVMVDHSKPSMALSPRLYERLQDKLMIIDHHRRGEEFPENPLLVYIEPYASSTCELITEMFEYQSRDSEPINKLEATAMLTGIIIDTKSFSMNTGTRTFDAASYLRSVGADLEMTRHFMKESATQYLQRNHLIDRVEFIGNSMAVCAGEDGRPYDPVTAAQAADSLLDVSGVHASFVITSRPQGKVGISARSNGEINVQLIMEKMGGGGHLSNAATQIEGQSVSQVKRALLAILEELAEDGDAQD
ncbi:DHH family phosphoesterase [Ligilactobacillus sp. Marseille-Q7487]|uniref:DHH family phosphoesterase n=1 Tax=Ligilactobacillus sp. Marseille-Q7487 TaxID=3022128 RepID=UPI0015B4F863|nr:DHH family phosphoesterase [Ligilactobacillus sp. Marseille-Q7487]